MKAKLLLLISMVGIGGCSQSQTQTQTETKKNILVVYFSHTGNTRVIAEQIRNATDADIFEIQPVKDYPTDYQTLVDQAQKEINADYKPELKAKVENIGQYDVIFVGSPCWWGTIAPPVATFLSSYDLSGKTIAPFMTHEGSGMGHSEADIKKLCPKSTVLEGLPIKGSYVNSAKNDVLKWLTKIKIIK